MKNKGMHQQPNAFTPSTGTNAPQGKTMNKGGFAPNHQGHSHSNQPQGWQRPQQPQASTPIPVPVAQGNTGKKHKKAA